MLSTQDDFRVKNFWKHIRNIPSMSDSDAIRLVLCVFDALVFNRKGWDQSYYVYLMDTRHEFSNIVNETIDQCRHDLRLGHKINEKPISDLCSSSPALEGRYGEKYIYIFGYNGALSMLKSLFPEFSDTIESLCSECSYGQTYGFVNYGRHRQFRRLARIIGLILWSNDLMELREDKAPEKRIMPHIRVDSWGTPRLLLRRIPFENAIGKIDERKNDET